MAAAPPKPATSRKNHVGDPKVSTDGKRKTYVVNGGDFEVDAHYDVIKVLGCGAYGTVCSAMDTRTSTKVAIKRMAGVFDDLIDGKRILREIQVLTSVSHPNILKLKSVLKPADPATFTDIYMVTALLDADLHNIISSRQPLENAHVKYFMAQLLRAVKYIHTGNIVHRDIKPANVLVTAKCDTVLCDFGLSRTVDAETLTTHVATRWYRAPELLVLSSHYSFAVDMWSVGCVLGELLQRRPLFQGSNYLHQLHLVLQFIGTPSSDALSVVSKEAQDYIKSLPKYPPVDLQQIFKKTKPEALDLMANMLRFRPEKRITAADSLKHPYLIKLHKPELEPASEVEHHFTLDEEDYTHASLRQAFLDIIDRIQGGGKGMMLAEPDTPCEGGAVSASQSFTESDRVREVVKKAAAAADEAGAPAEADAA